MTTTRPVLPVTLSALMLVLSPVACASPHDDGAEDVVASESAQTSSNCSFIPGCKRLLEASDGPFSATVMTYSDAEGQERRRLSLTYREAPSSSFLLCHLFPSQPNVTSVFILGPEHARTSVRRPMSVSCPTSYGDNGGLTNSASLGVVEDADQELWDTLFPPHADGSRWFALEVAATNAWGAWDSRYGQNYRLVFAPR